MTPKTINIVTNIMAFLLVVLVPIKNYLETQPFDWFTFFLCICGAVVGYFTGKSDLKGSK